MKIMDLFGGQKNFQLSEELCSKVAKAVLEGEGIQSNYLRMTDGDGMRMRLVSPDDLTHWEMSTASGPLTILDTRLRNKGQGTYSKVMKILLEAVKGTDTYIVVRDVRDPGTAQCLGSLGFVQEASSNDFVRVAMRR